MKRVVVAMSGGVDSSVAAALLVEQGYDVIGITFKTRNWEDTEARKFGGCCGSSDFFDARSVAQTLGIPHYNFDYVGEFRTSVIDYFKASYMAGETPNPCIACNQFVKFDRLLAQAQALGADFLATGHYARIERRLGRTAFASTAFVPTAFASNSVRANAVSPNAVSPNAAPPNAAEANAVEANAVEANAVGPNAVRFFLRKAIDPAKDQSYVLYHLGQEQLSKLLFPIGDYTKPQIREIARKHGLRTADKPDSQEICFVPNNDYRQFVAEEIPAGERPAGPIRHKDGRVIGQHQGLPFYTVGQRSGLGSVGKPVYVVEIDRPNNTLVVGDKEDVLARSLVIRSVHWTQNDPPELPIQVFLKIRYKHKEAAAVLYGEGGTGGWGDRESDRVRPASNSVPQSPCPPISPSNVRAVFDEPQSAVTPGQAAVFYDGDAVLGGGIIDHVTGA